MLVAQTLTGGLGEQTAKRQEVLASLTTEISAVDAFGKNLKTETNAYRDSLLYVKTVASNCASEEDGILQVYRNFILEQRKPEPIGGQPPLQSALDSYAKARKEAVAVPRLITVAGYQGLFDEALQNSELRRRQDATDEEIRLLKEEIARLHQRDGELNEQIELVEQRQSEGRAADKREQEEQNGEFGKKFAEHLRQINFGKEVAKQQNANFKAHKDEFETMEGDFVRFKDDFSKFRVEVFSHIRGNKEDLSEKMRESDAFFDELTKQLQEEIKDVRNLATNEMRAQEKDLVNRFSGQFEEVNDFVTKSVEHLKGEAKSLQDRFQQNTKKIKAVCSKYFGKYEVDLDELKIKINNLMDKYKDWQRILIEPATMNDARLYSLETRLNEEEEMRIREYEYVRDLLKKLLYSLEQVNMHTIDAKGLASNALNQQSEASQDAHKLGSGGVEKLPNLLVSGAEAARQSLQGGAGADAAQFNKSMEFMMMKRLNFLRNSLDSHNPHETTLRMRDNAQKKRDERILELWRKDQMQPSVETLISRMVAQKSKQARHDWSDDNAVDGELSLMQETDMRSIMSTEDKVAPTPT